MLRSLCLILVIASVQSLGAVDIDLSGTELTEPVVYEARDGSIHVSPPGASEGPYLVPAGADVSMHADQSVRFYSGTSIGLGSVVRVVIGEFPNQVPVADAQTVLATAAIPVDITLLGSDADGQALTFVVDQAPAGGVLSGTAPDLTYTPNAGFVGTDSFTFTVSDGELTSDPALVTIDVRAPPDAMFVFSPNGAPAGAVVSFDASATQSGSGSIDSYAWDFGDGESGSGVTVGHQFAAAGDYLVLLTVTDANGLEDTTSHLVTVADPLLPPVSGLIHLWRFNGNLLDSIGDKQVAIKEGDQAFADGIRNQALDRIRWDGQGTVAIDVTDAVTISGWFNYRVANGYLIANRAIAAASNGFMLRHDSLTNSMQMRLGDGLNTYDYNSDSGLVTVDEWHHFVIVMDSVGGTCSLFLDGVKVIDGVLYPSGMALSGTWTIGTGLSSTTSFKGLLDDFRVFDRALTDAEAIQIASEASNVEPVAIVTAPIGPIPAGSPIQFDGSGSIDIDGPLPLVYEWQIVSGNSTSVGATDQDTFLVTPERGFLTAEVLLNDGLDSTVGYNYVEVTLDGGPEQYTLWNQVPDGVGGWVVEDGQVAWTGSAGTIMVGDAMDASGDHYIEMEVISYEAIQFGVVPVGFDPTVMLGQTSESYAYYSDDGDKRTNGVRETYGTYYRGGDRIGIRLSAGELRFYKNGLDQGVAYTGLTGLWKFAMGSVSGSKNPRARVLSAPSQWTHIPWGTSPVYRNRPPEVQWTADVVSGPAPLQVEFDASTSFDMDGTIVEYAWDFGDGQTASGVQVDHVFMATVETSYEVTLTLTDDDGESAELSQLITVIPPDLDTGLLAYWTMDGDLLDASPNGNDGVSQGGLGFGAGYLDRAVQLDGVDDVIQVSNSSTGFLEDAFSARSVAMWVCPARSGVVESLFDEGDATNGLALRLGIDALEAVVSSAGGQTFLSGPPLVADTWQHVAVIFDQGSFTLFVDGEVVDQDVASATSVSSHPDSGVLGARDNDAFGASGLADFLDGKLDEVRVYSRALSPGEVRHLSELEQITLTAVAVTDAGVVLDWPSVSLGHRYVMLRDGVERHRVSGPPAIDTGMVSGQSYEYRMLTLDVDGRVLAQVGPLTVVAATNSPATVSLTAGQSIVADLDPLITGQHVVVDGVDVVIDGRQALASLQVLNGGVIKPSPTTATEVNGIELLVMGDVTVDATSSLDASGLGYLPGYTWPNVEDPGLPYASGGTHGGVTANGSGDAYGSMRWPVLPGAGTGIDESQNIYGAAGGGVIALQCDQLDLQGSIRSDGIDSPIIRAQGGSAGGSIAIRAYRPVALASVSAEGGSNWGSSNSSPAIGYSGGGGRIVIEHEGGSVDLSGVSALSRVHGKGLARAGSPGTVLSVDLLSDAQVLKLDNGAYTPRAWTPIWEGERRNGGDGAQVWDQPLLLGSGVKVELEDDLALKWHPAGSYASFGMQAIDIDFSGFDLNMQNSTMITDHLQADSLSLVASTMHSYVTDADREHKLTIDVSGACVIDIASVIDVSERGYLAGYTYGNTVVGASEADTYAAGGSHAGYGGIGSGDLQPAEVYGDFLNPTTLGSGAGARSVIADDASGGGAVILTAASLSHDGVITADGGDTKTTRAGAASAGGSVNISVGAYSGVGTISAKGGANTGRSYSGPLSGSGGGGRIAVRYDTGFIDPNLLSATIRCSQGRLPGGVGTIYLENRTTGEAILKLVSLDSYYPTASLTPVWWGDRFDSQDNPSEFSATLICEGRSNVEFEAGTNVIADEASVFNQTLISAGALTFKDQTLNEVTLAAETLQAQSLTITGPSSVEAQVVDAINLSLQDTTVLTHPTTTNIQEYGLDISVASTFDIAAGAMIDVTSKGYQPGYTVGNTTEGAATGNSGGSYGGLASSDASNNPYGDFFEPVDLGAGSNLFTDSNGVTGGAHGGGRIKITASSLMLNGVIKADGQKAPIRQHGAGAGGSILIECDSLTLDPAAWIQANGGSNTGTYSSGPMAHSGSGGRVSLSYVSGVFVNEQVRAFGTSNLYSSRVGPPGTVFLHDRDEVFGTLRIHNNGNSPEHPVPIFYGDPYTMIVDPAKIPIPFVIDLDPACTYTLIGALSVFDNDNDGLMSWDEAAQGTDPFDADTNDDGVLDGTSVALGVDPVSLDIDGDGLSNADEVEMGTDPHQSDSDYDGVVDGEDDYPLDPNGTSFPSSDPADTTPPVIDLLQPVGVVPL